MRKLRLLEFCILTLVLSACEHTSQVGVIETTEEANHVPENWEKSEGDNYSIQFPDTFDLDDQGKMGASFILFSKQTSPNDLFRENINLIIEDLSGKNVDLDKYVELSEGQISTIITGFNLTTSKRISEHNNEYHKMVYTGKQGELELKWQQLYWVQNENAYVLTFTCEEKQYDNYLPIGEKIMKTFKVK